MTSRIQLQSNDWLVFVEGVQVPFIGFSYSTGTDVPASGSLRLAPDSLMTNIRPHAVVSIFFKDRYPEVDGELAVEDRYVYFGGGEITTITVDKQPHAKGVQISFTNEMGIFDQHPAYATGIGGTYTSLIASGSVLVNPFSTGSTNDLFSIKLLNIFPSEANTQGSAYSYVDNMLGTLAWFSAHNASLRNRIVQHRLMHKFGGLNTLILKDVITRQVGAGLTQKVQEMISGDDTPLTIVQKLNTVPNYRYVSVPTPHYKKIDKRKIYPLNDEKDERLSRKFFIKDWQRNDTLFLPSMHYAAPPPCNFIFPDMIESISYTRTFRSEATRTTYEDNITKSPSQTQRVTFVSSDPIPGIGKVKNVVQFWGAAQEMLGSDKDLAPVPEGPFPEFEYPESPYLNARVDKENNPVNYNLLDSITDSELAKGVVTQRIQPDSEYVAALVKVNNELANGGLEQAVNGESQNETVNDYTKYVQQWTDYKHGLSKFNRQASFVIKGHRWLVPGFNAVIFDQDVSFICMIDAVNHMYDTSGNESTSISVSSARPISSIPDNVFSKSVKLANDITELKKNLEQTVTSAFNANKSVIDSLLTNIETIALKVDLLADVPAGIIEARLAFVSNGQAQQEAGSANTAVILQLLNAVAELVLVGNEVAAKVVGPQRDVSGSLTSQRYPAIAQEWISYLEAPLSSTTFESTTDLVDKILDYSKKLAANIKETLDIQAKQATNGEPWFATASFATNSVAQALVDSGVKLSESEAALRAIIRDLENNNNIPAPPDFYPQDLIELDLLDYKYQSLLGCKPFYSKLVPGSITGPGSGVTDPATGATIPENSDKSTHLTANQYLIKCFSQIFAGISAAGLPDQMQLLSNSGFKTWDSIIASDAESSLEWQHRTFLNRGRQTLREYLETHGFATTLQRYVSAEPTPTYFYVMTPLTPFITSTVYLDENTKTPYQFDNSSISRLVDELAIYGGSGSYDPLVADRRNKVRDPSATGQFRQEQIIHYSRKHMGARAYRGD